MTNHWIRPLADPVQGELEATLVESFMTAASLRKWLSRSDQPDSVKVIQMILAKTFPPGRGTFHENTLLEPDPSDDTMQIDDTSPDADTPRHVKILVSLALERGSNSTSLVFRKRIRLKGIMFSTRETHKGNSVIEFYVHNARTSQQTSAGTIEHIAMIDDDSTFFVIRPYAPLPRGAIDPFVRYKDFPATVYANSQLDFVTVNATKIKSHAAAYTDEKRGRTIIISLSRY